MRTKFILLMVLFASSLDLMAQCGFFDGFETGSYSPNWTNGGSHVFSVTTTTPYAGTYRLEGVGGNSTHLQGLSASIPDQTPDSISWTIYPIGTAVSTNYFVAGDASVSSTNCMVFCYRQAAGQIRFVASSTYIYTAPENTWYYIQLKNINWVAHTYDIYINGALQTTGFPFRSTAVNSISSIHLYNFNSGTGVWDNIRVGALTVAFAGTDMVGCHNNDVVMSPVTPLQGSGAWSGGGGTWNGNTYTPSVGENSMGAIVDGIWTVTDGDCTATDTAVITVTPILPAPSITASSNNVCAGTQVTLTANPAAGYTNAEYVWYKNGSAVNYQNGGPGTYVVNAGTTAATNHYNLEVVYMGYGCTSMLSASSTIVTNAPSATITPGGPTTFCANVPTTLVANGGMSAYVWKRSNTIVATNTGSYTPTVSGNHNVTVTDANGCSKTSAWTGITVKAIPTANAGVDKGVCEGSSVQIGGAASAGNTYTWSPLGGISNSFSSNPMVSATGTVVYTVTVNNANTGCSNSDGVLVTLLGLPPTPSVTSAPMGNYIHLTANTPAASTINWYRDGASLYANQTPNSSINVYASNPQKAYTVKSKGANGCLSLASNAVNVRMGDDKGGDLVIGMENIGMQAFPNPTTGVLNVSVMYDNKESGKLMLYNGLGQVVMAEDIYFAEGKASVELDLGALAAGVYSLVFEEFVVKVVKE